MEGESEPSYQDLLKIIEQQAAAQTQLVEQVQSLAQSVQNLSSSSQSGQNQRYPNFDPEPYLASGVLLLMRSAQS